MLHQSLDVHIRHAVAVGEAKGVVEIVAQPRQASAGEGGFPRIHQGDLPRLSILFVNLHMVGIHVKGHIAAVQKVIGKYSLIM